MPTLIDVIRPDARMRFNLRKLLPEVARYQVFAVENQGILIVPVTEEDAS